MINLKLRLLKGVIKVSEKFGKGSAFPGLLAQKLHYNINNIDLTTKKIIYVIGTNGKTTTTNLIYQLLKDNQLNVITNFQGANLYNGIITLLLKHLNYNNQLDCDYILLEVDEKTIKQVINILPPQHVVITNFFRDQLDRYGEIDMIVTEIKKALALQDSILYLNGDDPYLYYQFLEFNHKIFYGIKSDYDVVKQEKRDYDNYHKTREIIYCPLCGNKLHYDYYHYAHLGKFYCNKCQITPQINYLLTQNSDGFIIDNHHYLMKNLPLYFLFNIIASVSLIKNLNLSIMNLSTIIKAFHFPQGRNQVLKINDQNIYLNLVKNVVGFEETIDYVTTHYQNYTLILCINDNYADGKDISWLYDVYLDPLLKQANQVYTCGLRAYDMALRVELNNYDNIIVIENIEKCLAQALHHNDQKVIISNYTALSSVNNFLNKEQHANK